MWDFVVNPSWQGCGIGRGMVERLVRGLVHEGIFNVSLFSEPGVMGLYRECGFVGEPEGTTGMGFRAATKPAPRDPTRGNTGPGPGPGQAMPFGP